MNMHGPSLVAPSATQNPCEALEQVAKVLNLESQEHPLCERVRVLSRPGSSPIAAILEQGETFREDKGAIQALKGADRDLPIIYIAKTAQPRRETAVRRMCIHYYLAQPVEISELKLVLEVLVRSTVSSTSFERFFTR